MPVEAEDSDTNDEDRMDWMTVQLRQLIAEGQKALGKQIVVDADVPAKGEDGFEDDGDGGWDDEVVEEAREASPYSSNKGSRGHRRQWTHSRAHSSSFVSRGGSASALESRGTGSPVRWVNEFGRPASWT